MTHPEPLGKEEVLFLVQCMNTPAQGSIQGRSPLCKGCSNNGVESVEVPMADQATGEKDSSLPFIFAGS